MKMKIIGITILTVLLASCGPNTTVTTTGTGKYPNSVYTSTVSKSIEPAIFGAPNSKVQIKIFSDYECPSCQNFHYAIEGKLWKDYINTNKITVTFYNYPLTGDDGLGNIKHPNAEGDALAGLCALADGKFKEFHDAMYDFEAAKKWAPVTDTERVEVATKAGITDTQFGQCISQAWYQKSLEKEIDEGNRLELGGTPSVYLNDNLMKFGSEDDFFKIIDAALNVK